MEGQGEGNDHPESKTGYTFTLGGISYFPWNSCIKREVRKAEEDDKWREKGTAREKWEGITARKVQHHMN